MICSHCGKREVEVLIKQVINQEVHDLNLCRVCAEELGFISPDTPSITISFSLNEPDAAQKKKTRAASKDARERRYDSLRCEVCGMEYVEFRNTKLLGCGACYSAFRFPLGAYLQQEQGAESHWSGNSNMFEEIGVVAEHDARTDTAEEERERQDDIERLRSELADAVSREEYERAAELRDRLLPLLTCSRQAENED